MSDYGVKDIKTLEGIEAIRLRPGIIINTILKLKSPFNLTDIFYLLPNYPQSMIKNIIDELCEAEILRYVEIDNDCYGFIQLPAAARLLVE
jgi:DNA gyrase/topoisomerase IV subunit B